MGRPTLAGFDSTSDNLRLRSLKLAEPSRPLRRFQIGKPFGDAFLAAVIVRNNGWVRAATVIAV
jgi:hypothetical protein